MQADWDEFLSGIDAPPDPPSDDLPELPEPMGDSWAEAVALFREENPQYANAHLGNDVEAFNAMAEWSKTLPERARAEERARLELRESKLVEAQAVLDDERRRLAEDKEYSETLLPALPALPALQKLGRKGYTPAPEPVVSEPRRIRVQIEQPTENNPSGTIVEGFERHSDSQVRVYDTQGQLLGTDSLRPEDDVEAAAKKLLTRG